MNTICKFALLGTAAADLVETQPHSEGRHALRRAKQEVFAGDNGGGETLPEDSEDQKNVANMQAIVKSNYQQAFDALMKAHTHVVDTKINVQYEAKRQELFQYKQAVVKANKAVEEAQLAKEEAQRDFKGHMDSFHALNHTLQQWKSTTTAEADAYFGKLADTFHGEHKASVEQLTAYMKQLNANEAAVSAAQGGLAPIQKALVESKENIATLQADQNSLQEALAEVKLELEVKSSQLDSEKIVRQTQRHKLDLKKAQVIAARKTLAETREGLEMYFHESFLSGSEDSEFNDIMEVLEQDQTGLTFHEHGLFTNFADHMTSLTNALDNTGVHVDSSLVPALNGHAATLSEAPDYAATLSEAPKL